MTKKKRELIDILLDNITPDDWPEDAKFAAQDKKSLVWGKNKLMFYKQDDPPFVKTGATIFSGNASGNVIALPELCCNWSKTIVTRDEFVKRWNERNAPGEAKTPQQLAIEKFGTGWHENDGKTPPLPEGLTIDIEFKNGTIRTDRAKNDSDFDIPYYADEEFTIKRWRIHSDQASLLREPMPLFGEEIPCRFVDDKSPLDTQIGGNHYTKLAIQPMRYSMENRLDALQHTVIKYVTRFRDKNGIEDLEKAKHCIDMLIEFERSKK